MTSWHTTNRGGHKLVIDGYEYRYNCKYRKTEDEHLWKCVLSNIRKGEPGCPGRAHSQGLGSGATAHMTAEHNHLPTPENHKSADIVASIRKRARE